VALRMSAAADIGSSRRLVLLRAMTVSRHVVSGSEDVGQQWRPTTASVPTAAVTSFLSQRQWLGVYVADEASGDTSLTAEPTSRNGFASRGRTASIAARRGGVPHFVQRCHAGAGAVADLAFVAIPTDAVVADLTVTAARVAAWLAVGRGYAGAGAVADLAFVAIPTGAVVADLTVTAARVAAWLAVGRGYAGAGAVADLAFVAIPTGAVVADLTVTTARVAATLGQRQRDLTCRTVQASRARRWGAL
jgi:hypothetical protein